MQGKQQIPRRHYTDDFKAQAVTLASSIGQAQAARKLDMSADAELALRTALRTLHADSRGTYARPRLVHGLRTKGQSVSE